MIFARVTPYSLNENISKLVCLVPYEDAYIVTAD